MDDEYEIESIAVGIDHRHHEVFLQSHDGTKIIHLTVDQARMLIFAIQQVIDELTETTN